MTPDERFDELARQKMEERSFPFDASHWQQMEQSLAAQEKRRSRKGFWWSGAALLMVLVAWLWWPGGSTTTSPEQPVAIVPERTQPSPPAVEPAPLPASQVETQAEAARAVEVRSGQVLKDDPLPIAHSTAQVAADVDPQAGSTAYAKASATPVPPSTASAGPDLAVNTTSPVAEFVLVPQATEAVITSDVSSTTSTSVTENLEPTEPASEPDVAVGGMAEEVGVDTPDGDSAPSTVTDESPLALVEGPSATTTDADPVSQEAEQNSDAMVHGDDSRTEEPPLVAEEPSEDLTVVPNDSLGTAPEAMDLSPLVSHTTPWEIGVLAGVQTSNTTYRGANHNANDFASTPLRNATFGVEFMRMGRNFGIGTGLHYVTHDEELRTGSITEDITTIQRYWYLTPVDTTILFVTDTINVGGEPQYTGVSVETTIPVITAGADTSNTTVVDREARTVINRVSYFEVPLLLDAHLVQGRWHIGMRGGPTVGMLSGRRGSIANSTGYTDFNEQAFREVMIGWTARAYVRYRFNAAWSVGVEPMLRGQLLNGLEGEALDRRSTAWGAMLSLSYRLH